MTDLLKPIFPTHSLQIHCIRFFRSKFIHHLDRGLKLHSYKYIFTIYLLFILFKFKLTNIIWKMDYFTLAFFFLKKSFYLIIIWERERFFKDDNQYILKIEGKEISSIWWLLKFFFFLANSAVRVGAIMVWLWCGWFGDT